MILEATTVLGNSNGYRMILMHSGEVDGKRSTVTVNMKIRPESFVVIKGGVIQPGDSGGAVLNDKGHVVGMACLNFTSQGEIMSAAIDALTLEKVFSQLTAK